MHHTTMRKTTKKNLKNDGKDSKDAEQQEFSSAAGGNTKRCSHFGRWFDSYLQS